MLTVYELVPDDLKGTVGFVIEVFSDMFMPEFEESDDLVGREYKERVERLREEIKKLHGSKR